MVSGFQGGSLDVRARGLVVGFLMGLRVPFTGVGVGQTSQFFDDVSAQVAEWSADPEFYPDLPLRNYLLTDTRFNLECCGVFNIFMNAWAETGLIGLVAIAGLLSLTGFKGVRGVLLAGREITSLNFVAALFLALVCYHQVIYMWFHPWLWTVVALTYASADLVEERLAGPAQRPGPE